MNKRIYFLPLLCLVISFLISCSETDDVTEYVNWQERNEAFIDSLQRVYDAKTDPNLFCVVDREGVNVFYKKIRSVSEGEPPYFTSRVYVYKRGMLIDEQLFASTNTEFYSTLYAGLTVFDRNFSGDDPGALDSPIWLYMQPRYNSSNALKYPLMRNGLIAIAQIMREGERWEVYVPWQSGYGNNSANSTSYYELITTVPGYSALIYDIELIEIDYYPDE